MNQGTLPELHRWESILHKDAISACISARSCANQINKSKDFSFGQDGTLKDSTNLKRTISNESSKFYMNMVVKRRNSTVLHEHETELQSAIHAKATEKKSDPELNSPKRTVSGRRK